MLICKAIAGILKNIKRQESSPSQTTTERKKRNIDNNMVFTAIGYSLITYE
jgi:hypothetical protein